MLQFIGRMMKFPLEAFVYSMEMFVRTVRDIQQLAFQDIDALVNEVAQPLTAAPGDERPVTSERTNAVPRDFTSEAPKGTDGEIAIPTYHPEEKGKMAERDKDLGGDDLKLVRYKILFVKRDLEYAFSEQEALVYENMNATGFTAWKTAEFIQQLAKRNTQVPGKWQQAGYDYPPNKPEYRDGDILLGLPDEDKKYLRVYYEVLEHYPREPLEYEDQQLRVLREIRDKMKI